MHPIGTPRIARYLLYSTALHLAAASGLPFAPLYPASVTFSNHSPAFQVGLLPAAEPPTETQDVDPGTQPKPHRAEAEQTPSPVKVELSTTRPMPGDSKQESRGAPSSTTPEIHQVTLDDAAQGAFGTDLNRPPSLLASPKPPYPYAARRMGFEGELLVDIGVAADGAVSSVRIIESSGRADCDRSAEETIRNHWRFAPAQRAGRPAESSQRVQIVYRLDESQ